MSITCLDMLMPSLKSSKPIKNQPMYHGGRSPPYFKMGSFLVHFSIFCYIFEPREYHQSIQLAESFKTQSEKLKLVFFIFFMFFRLPDGPGSVPDAPRFDPRTIPNRCQIDARSMPDRCRIDAGSRPNRCQIDVKSMPDRCQINAKSMPDRCQIDAKSMPIRIFGGLPPPIIKN